MHTGNRETWAALLPYIQAFVDGTPIQRLNFYGRWEDVVVLHDLLASGCRLRMKPLKVTQGLWQRPFKISEPGDENGPTGSGIMTWRGADSDAPPWTNRSSVEWLGEATFMPDADVELTVVSL